MQMLNFLVCCDNLLFYIMKFHKVYLHGNSNFHKAQNCLSVSMINTIAASYHQGICYLEEMCCQGKSRVRPGFNNCWPHCQSSWWGELIWKPRNHFSKYSFQIFSSTPYTRSRASLICLVLDLWDNLPLVVFDADCLLQDPKSLLQMAHEHFAIRIF